MDPVRVAVATNEPEGGYHLAPLQAALARRRDVQVTHLSPDGRGAVPPGVGQALGPVCPPDTNVLVVTGATAWPAQVVAANPHLPVVASCLAYLTPDLAVHAASVTDRLVTVTAAGAGDARAFAAHLGTRRPIQQVGTPALDVLPVPARTGHVLVLPTVTGGSGPAAACNAALAACADRLVSVGHDVVVRLHPREPVGRWARFAIDSSPTVVDAAAGATAVLAVPGTALGWVAALRVPIIGITRPDLAVPEHLLALCGGVLSSQGPVAALDGLMRTRRPAPRSVIDVATGPVDGHAGDRLLQAWSGVGRHPSTRRVRTLAA